MNRRSFLSGGVTAATLLLLGACRGYKKVDNPDPADWVNRDRDREWMEDDENFPKPRNVSPKQDH